MKKIAILLIFIFLAGISLPALSAEVFDTPVDTYVMSKEDLKAQKRAEKEAAKQIKREKKNWKKERRKQLNSKRKNKKNLHV